MYSVLPPVQGLYSLRNEKCCGSGIQCLYDPGSGIGFFSDPGSQPIFLRAKMIFVTTKKVGQPIFFHPSFVAVFGSGIRDGQKSGPGLNTRIRNTGDDRMDVDPNRRVEHH